MSALFALSAVAETGDAAHDGWVQKFYSGLEAVGSVE
jgi:hypothetical protein